MPTMNPIKVRVTGEPDERIVRAYINGGLVVTAVENATGWGLCDEDWLPAPSEVMGGGLPGWTKYPGDDRFPAVHQWVRHIASQKLRAAGVQP